MQVTNFAAAGTLYLAGATGLFCARDPLLGGRLGPALFADVGLGLLGSAAFCTDPVSGYPPGAPDSPSDRTTTGAMHNIAAVPIFPGIPAVALASPKRTLSRLIAGPCSRVWSAPARSHLGPARAYLTTPEVQPEQAYYPASQTNLCFGD